MPSRVGRAVVQKVSEAPDPVPDAAPPVPGATTQESAVLVEAGVEAAAAPSVSQAPPPDVTGVVVGSFRDAVGLGYKLTNVACTIDGIGVASGRPTRGTLFEQRLAPGRHQLQVVASYQGQGTVFTYLNEYNFGGQIKQEFTVETGATTRIAITAFDRGGPTVPYEERLALTIEVK